MPYIRDLNEEESSQQPQAPGDLRLSSPTSGSSSVVDSASTGSSPGKTGSHFQNLANYLNTNDAKGFGQQVGARVQGDITQGKNLINQNVGQVRNQINQTGSVASQDQIRGAVQSPESFDKNTYRGWINNQYTGPLSLQDNPSASNAVSGAISNAQVKANQAGSEAGRFSLLDSYFGRPDYSFGQKSLDNLLIQQGGGLNNAKSLQNDAAKLGGYAQEQQKKIVNEAAQRAGDVARTREQSRAALGLTENNTLSGSGALPDFINNLNQRVSGVNQGRSDLKNRVVSDLGDDRFSDETLAQLNLPPGTNLYNLDVKNYVRDPGSVSKEQVASDADYNRYLALSQLAGMDPSFLTEATRGQAGKINPASVVDKEGLMRDLVATKSDYENRLKQIQGKSINAPNDQSLSLLDALNPGRPIQDYLNSEAQKAEELKQLEALYNPNRGVGGVTPTPDTLGSIAPKPLPVYAPSPEKPKVVPRKVQRRR